jgi:hypothetical protein
MLLRETLARDASVCHVCYLDTYRGGRKGFSCRRYLAVPDVQMNRESERGRELAEFEDLTRVSRDISKSQSSKRIHGQNV